VEGATFASSTRSQPTYLNVGKAFPEPDRFSVVIFGDDRPNFRRPPEDTYEGKEIAVAGEVSEFRGVPQVIVNHPNDIAVCG
jgi:endonuclease G